MPTKTPAKRFKHRWVETFLVFLSLMKIPSKELTEPGPITPYDAQMIFLHELDDGLDAGQHEFVCLKARQLGITTILLALDIFWLYMHPGLQGALVADTHENRETFRQTITQMLDSLPKGFRVPITGHNRGSLMLSNGSRLQYMSAGKGKNSGLGRSRALNFLHASEISSWGDQIGIDSLIAGLSETNPNRMYMWESTALGFNVFYDLHKAAKADSKKRAFFIGWWSKGSYQIPETDPDFQTWWGDNPALDTAEAEIDAIVKAEYGYTITPSQWAWYRKKAWDRSELSLKQEFPSYEKEAWQTTGAPFFAVKRVNADMEFIRGRLGFSAYKYDLPNSFSKMSCSETRDATQATLRIWELPVKNAKYAMGVDVAFGRSETNDRHCISVFRCFSDKICQVAEYTTSVPETRTVAWVLAHLAGSYRDCMINLETTGPGIQVMDEMKNLRQQINTHHLRQLEPIFRADQALDQARWYLYHRPDQPGGGYLYGFRTNAQTKSTMYNSFRDAYNTEQVIIRSVPLLEEMITLVQNGAAIQASARNKDDRVFAAGLANHAWASWIRASLMAENRTYQMEMAKQQKIEDYGGNVITSLIPTFFKEAEQGRRDQQLRQLLGAENRYR